jgi:hypothetical protein
MKAVIKIILSNWINLLTVFVVVYSVGVVSAMAGDKFSWKGAVFGTAYAVLGYGMIFWIGFAICILILDMLLFGIDRNPGNTTIKLFVEWLVIGCPFVYWLLVYREWILIAVVLSFLFGQYLRRSHINKILALH